MDRCLNALPDRPPETGGVPCSTRATTKHLFVTGGVASSLGKGLTASSLGQLLTSRGLRVTMQKLDPYLNVDPGTMNPFQHGEVFVTEDGAETDLDIGHYERFLDRDLPAGPTSPPARCTPTVIAKERRGEYLGDTVQVIPHITNEIKDRDPRDGATRTTAAPPDVVITEVGGTVGDIESLPFLEAARQVRHEVGRDNCFFLHVSLVPYLAPSGELKTKPTQHSVAALRNIGIQPDALVLRADREIPDEMKRKISLMCDVDVDGVVAAPTRRRSTTSRRCCTARASTPTSCAGSGCRSATSTGRCGATCSTASTSPSETRRDRARRQVRRPARRLPLGHRGAAGGRVRPPRPGRDRLGASRTTCATPAGAAAALDGVDGVLVPGGFGVRGIEGKLGAIGHARTRGIPTLGLCLGLQCMVIEAARSLAGLDGANSAEFDPRHPAPGDLDDGRPARRRRRRARHGRHDAPGRLPGRARRRHGRRARPTAPGEVSERHRHRYEVNNAYRTRLDEAGLVFGGTSPDGTLVEFVELPPPRTHPFFVGTQAHPELKSRPTRPHPLFAAFVEAALRYRAADGCRSTCPGARAEPCRRAAASPSRASDVRSTPRSRPHDPHDGHPPHDFAGPVERRSSTGRDDGAARRRGRDARRAGRRRGRTSSTPARSRSPRSTPTTG